MIDIIIATKNKDKVVEIKKILEGMDANIKAMSDIGIDIDIEETGTTFEENAMIKAKSIYDITHSLVIADDSGLEIDYLDGAPGIYSSRFAGEDASYDEKIGIILDKLKDAKGEERSARFVCAIAVCMPDGSSFTVKDTCEGYIADAPCGENGFGYDPVFYMKEYGMTTAQMDEDMKNSISHRGKALRQMRDRLESILK